MNGWKTIEVRIKGIVPLMTCNGRLANPLDPIAKAIKAITDKRKKTDEDHERIAELQWEGGLYLDEESRVVIPGYVIEGALAHAAKALRLKAVVQGGIICDGTWPLEYSGPKDLDKLKADPRFRDTRGARPQGKTVMRTRPIFDKWSLAFVLHYDPTVLNPDQINQMLGRACIGDYKPKFGRFVVEEFKHEAKPAARSA